MAEAGATYKAEACAAPYRGSVMFYWQTGDRPLRGLAPVYPLVSLAGLKISLVLPRWAKLDDTHGDRQRDAEAVGKQLSLAFAEA